MCDYIFENETQMSQEGNLKSKYLYPIPGQKEIGEILFPVSVESAILDEVKDLEFHPSDVLLVGYPRSGLSWLAQVVSLIHNVERLEEVDQTPLSQRVPYLEIQDQEGYNTMELLKGRQSPRIIKTHLSVDFFRKQLTSNKLRAIVIMRNPKDTLASYYHFYKQSSHLGKFAGSWAEFFKLFKAKQIIHGDWYDHALGWLEYKDDVNVLFLKYEDFHKDLLVVIELIANFCNRKLQKFEIESVGILSSFEMMKENPNIVLGDPKGSDNKDIFRHGQIGRWKDVFTVEHSEYLDDLFEIKMADTDLDFEEDDKQSTN